MANTRNPDSDGIENDDAIRTNDEEIVGRADEDDEEFEDIEDEDEDDDENVEEGE